MGNWKEEWKGTKKEQRELIEEVLQDIKAQHFEEMNQADFNKLFNDAFCRTLVQSELSEMMLYIVESQDGAK